jgi:hypothetical protein
MHNAYRVRLGNCITSLKDVGHCVRNGQCALVANNGLQVVAIEVLHHHVRRTGFQSADVMDSCDMIALQARGGTSLANETFDDFCMHQRGGQQELDGEEFAQLDVPSCNDDTHAALPKHLFHPVLAQKDVPRLDARLNGRVRLRCISRSHAYLAQRKRSARVAPAYYPRNVRRINTNSAPLIRARVRTIARTEHVYRVGSRTLVHGLSVHEIRQQPRMTKARALRIIEGDDPAPPNIRPQSQCASFQGLGRAVENPLVGHV